MGGFCLYGGCEYAVIPCPSDDFLVLTEKHSLLYLVRENCVQDFEIAGELIEKTGKPIEKITNSLLFPVLREFEGNSP